eukprot:scaffold13804_cov53-Cylindrotheca_fusiformis.AAC.1
MGLSELLNYSYSAQEVMRIVVKGLKPPGHHDRCSCTENVRCFLARTGRDNDPHLKYQQPHGNTAVCHLPSYFSPVCVSSHDACTAERLLHGTRILDSK